jgi:putative transposase
MSRKKTTYSIELKTKLVLEVLKGESTLNEIASRDNIIPKNLQNWKAKFLANAEFAMEPSKAVKEYKDENKELHAKIDEYAKVVGKITVERDWLQGKLKGLDLSDKQELVETKPKNISLSKQTELLEICRSAFYYTPVKNEKKISIKKQIEKIFEEIPIYGEKKVHQQLLEDGFTVSLNTVSKYRRELGLKAVLAVKPISTTVADIQHKKHSYKLRGLEINRANQVWSTDITYIKINGGMVYMAAVIDWYSKAVLSWEISNCMDTDLVMGVLNKALEMYGKPEIFNTDQGSQYTSFIHTQTLKDNEIIISMDGKGRATDNICIERFWRSAKCERIYLNEYFNMKELKDDVKDYINFYNHKRFHETLEYKKPMSVFIQSLKINNIDYDYEKMVEIVA